MSNYLALKEYRKIKRYRRRLDRLGSLLFCLGFIGLITITDIQEFNLSSIILLLSLLGSMGVGAILTNYVDFLNEEFPVSLKMVEKGDKLCYTVSTTKQKDGVYND